MVATNQRPTTGQRCLALHIASRTVVGSRPGELGEWSADMGSWGDG
jgi:hypothetical protein